jgi:very-short-patch-repair endonuclease
MSRSSHPYSTQLEVRAREMRLCRTLSEASLAKGCGAAGSGFAFRRQAVIGDYIVDFFARAVSFVIGIDGGYHFPRCRADARHERNLVRSGYPCFASRRAGHGGFAGRSRAHRRAVGF